MSLNVGAIDWNVPVEVDGDVEEVIIRVKAGFGWTTEEQAKQAARDGAEMLGLRVIDEPVADCFYHTDDTECLNSLRPSDAEGWDSIGALSLILDGCEPCRY